MYWTFKNTNFTLFVIIILIIYLLICHDLVNYVCNAKVQITNTNNIAKHDAIMRQCRYNFNKTYLFRVLLKCNVLLQVIIQ